jgi:tRNA 2-thiouridine synthesizing protein A
MGPEQVEEFFPTPAGIHVDEFLDLRGRQCPMTFVYTKVKLERMEPGKVLQVLLDFRSAFKNVPESVKKQHLGEILAEIEKEGQKSLWIRRIASS